MVVRNFATLSVRKKLRTTGVYHALHVVVVPPRRPTALRSTPNTFNPFNSSIALNALPRHV